MDLSNNASPLLLAKGRSLTLTDADPMIIRCQTGTLWVTQDNDVRDVVLEAGGVFRPDRRGPVVVYALAASRVVCSPADPVGRSPWRALSSRLVQRLIASVEPRHPAIE